MRMICLAGADGSISGLMFVMGAGDVEEVHFWQGMTSRDLAARYLQREAPPVAATELLGPAKGRLIRFEII
jgi:hypothetical protein